MQLEEADLANTRSMRDLLLGRIGGAERQMEIYTAKLSELESLYKEYRVYELYQNAVDRNGVPYMILRTVLPIIESEVNSVLESIVDFRFRLCIGDNDTIDSFIEYDGNTWPIELVSGMEKFIISLATRSSLVRLSVLPKPNFLCIDEGFGVLDVEKLWTIQELLNRMRSEFGFVLCISHIEAMRDMVDMLIDIDKSTGFSRVRYL